MACANRESGLDCQPFGDVQSTVSPEAGAKSASTKPCAAASPLNLQHINQLLSAITSVTRGACHGPHILRCVHSNAWAVRLTALCLSIGAWLRTSCWTHIPITTCRWSRPVTGSQRRRGCLLTGWRWGWYLQAGSGVIGRRRRCGWCLCGV